MRYVTHYVEYPIYEPAEGGYYYAGNEVFVSERMSKRKAREEFDRIWSELKRLNEIEFGCAEPHISSSHPVYPWIRVSPNRIVKYSRYIGEGESYVVERRCGSESRGKVPYC